MKRPSDAILLAGRDHLTYGAIHVEAAGDGASACAISVGADAASPSLRAKGDPESCPNEDAVLIWDDGDQALIAVADAHWGDEPSRRLLELLRDVVLQDRPLRPRLLYWYAIGLAYPEDEPADQPHAETTLVAAVLTRSRGDLTWLGMGDSTLAILGPDGEHRLTEKEMVFGTAEYPETLRDARLHVGWRAEVPRGSLLVAFTDGVDECHYGHPETSVGAAHREALFHEVGPDPSRYVHALANLALEGVDGHPGGQDNVAVAATRV